MNQYACAITGHRPTRFCFGYNEEDPLCQKLKECLLEQFRILHDEKFVRTFLSAVLLVWICGLENSC